MPKDLTNYLADKSRIKTLELEVKALRSELNEKTSVSSARMKNTVNRMTTEIGGLNRKLKKSNDDLLKIRGLAMRAVDDMEEF